MNVCTPEVNTLSLRDVNTSSDVPFNYVTQQNGFTRDQESVLVSCEEAIDPFASFCNIPQPSDFDPMFEMCSISLQSGVPESLFERLVRGDISHPDQLTAIYESSLLVVDNPPQFAEQWISVIDSLSINIGPNELDYLGATLRNINDVAASNDCACFIAVRAGVLLQASPDGLLRRGFLQDGITTVFGFDDLVQGVRTSAHGFVRVAIFSNALFFFVNSAWQTTYKSPYVESGVRFQSVFMWQVGSRVYLGVLYSALLIPEIPGEPPPLGWKFDIFSFFDNGSNTPESFIIPMASYGQIEAGFQLGFVTTTPDNSLILFSTFASAVETHTLLIHSLPLMSNGGIAPGTVVHYARWTITSSSSIVPSSSSPSVALLISAVVFFDESGRTEGPLPSLSLLAAFNSNILSALLDQNTDRVLERNVTSTPQLVKICQSLDHSRTLYVLNDLVVGQNGAIDTTPPPFSLSDGVTLPYAFALSADGQDVWTLRDTHTLLRLHNPLGDPAQWGTAWTSDFTLYDALGVRVDDLGTPSLNHAVYNPGGPSTTWYMGTTHIASEAPYKPLQSPPLEIGRSLHGTFRFAITTVKTTVVDSISALNLRAFPYAIGSLQRANECAIAAHSNTIILRNNSNIEISDENHQIIWQTHTTDQVSDNDATSEAQSVFTSRIGAAIASLNGLYLLYVADGFRLRLVFNAFNSERFWQWCNVSDDRFAEAVAAQRAFCWNALKNPNAASFADSRCSCIGGKALFQLLVPEEVALPNTSRAALEQNLPCFAEDCSGGSNGTGETMTNVRRYVTQRCSNRSLQICRSAINIRGGEFKNVGFVHYTDCFLGTDQIRCTDKTPCGANSVCVNGRCTARCATDGECEQFFGTATLNCVDNYCQPALAKPPPKLSGSAILAIVFGIIVAFLLFLFILLLAMRKPVLSLTPQKQEALSGAVSPQV